MSAERCNGSGNEKTPTPQNGDDPPADVELRLQPKENEQDYISSLIMEVSKDESFHGSVAMEDAIETLKSDGDFLLRTPIDAPANQMVLSVQWKGRVCDYPFLFSKIDGQPYVSLNGVHAKGSVRELIRDHLTQNIPVDGSIRLVRASARLAWQLPLTSISLDEKIGEGAFGSVWKGRLKDPKAGTDRNVAVKVTKESDSSKRDEILLEARVMRQFKHPNVVQFFGVSVDATQTMIVMELINGGSLDKYLKKNMKISDMDRGSFCFDVACGLGYLHSKHFLHRDMASRNCLIGGDTNTVKLSDFGMSKQGLTYKISATERTPIRWQAPEVMKTAIYSIKCDVYSYGMVMYEIFSGGKIPFEGIDNKVIRHKIHDPLFRPQIVDEWPVEVRAIMTFCWRAQPTTRPTMEGIASVLKVFSKHDAGQPARNTLECHNKTPISGLQISQKVSIRQSEGSLTYHCGRRCNTLSDFGSRNSKSQKISHKC